MVCTRIASPDRTREAGTAGRRRSAIVLGGLLAAALSTACGSVQVAMVGRETRTAVAPEIETGELLSGESLVQRKLEMRRAARDLAQFGATVQTMRLRRDSALRDFQDFLDTYVDDRVDTLLIDEQTNDDPELALLDAELRLIKADLLIETRDYWSAGDVIDSIEDRYGSRRSMLVRFPVGRQSTVEEAIVYLRERNKGAPSQWIVPSPGA